MIQKLTLKNFKSFSEPKVHEGQWEGTSISFGGLSLIVGTNASGKSNIRDGLRFIHAISRGYTLAEIIGEKYGEEGVLQWKGIRGGVRETVTRNGNSADEQFTISVTTKLASEDGGDLAHYSITVNLGQRPRAPRVVAESLMLGR
ncbi:MAG TPA: AAA family ATPase, partial [Blastocatellia bacterium]|nr:AAA family ATPase [Blastocatellia bacterium]